MQTADPLKLAFYCKMKLFIKKVAHNFSMALTDCEKININESWQNGLNLLMFLVKTFNFEGGCWQWRTGMSCWAETEKTPSNKEHCRPWTHSSTKNCEPVLHTNLPLHFPFWTSFERPWCNQVPKSQGTTNISCHISYLLWNMNDINKCVMQGITNQVYFLQQTKSEQQVLTLSGNECLINKAITIDLRTCGSRFSSQLGHKNYQLTSASFGSNKI